MNQGLSPKLEMYLKTIHQLTESAGEGADPRQVLVKDIARAMEVTMPSVSEAISTLKGRGLVLHEAYGAVRLTAKGARLGREINERFVILRRFLIDVLRVSPTIADLEACEIEHVVGKDTLRRLNTYLEFMLRSGRESKGALDEFHVYLENHLRGVPSPDATPDGLVDSLSPRGNPDSAE